MSTKKSKSERSKSRTQRNEHESKKKKNKTIGQYTLGDQLGRGGFGVVYKGLNTETGDFVAVKQISLKGSTKETIAQIQSEINLLKKLNHPNIVKYIDNKQTKNKLYIIIEYVENGSLQDIVKKFGNMSEPLVAMYIKQVLVGLKYLHEEGVIHRDIKGANILTTKDSIVKLADFGVAASLNEVEANNPVGTPYWMAPEIIEMNPPTQASDIWSLGCTVIELLTGEPPYFNLDAMPALYRIVQDEHPPIPECSRACEDFLLQCFKKDPKMRKTAAKLLNHPWIKSATKAKLTKEPALKPIKEKPKEEEEEEINFDIPDEKVKEPKVERKVTISSINPETAKKLQQWTNDDDDDDDFKELENIELKITNLPQQRRSYQFDNIKDVKFMNVLENANTQTRGFELKDFKDDDDEEFFDDIDEEKFERLDIEEIDFEAKLKQKMDEQKEGNEDDDEDPFQDIIESQFDEIEIEYSKRDDDKLEQEALGYLSVLRPDKSEQEILEACSKLIELLKSNPQLNRKLTSNYGVLPIVEVLDVTNEPVIHAILQVVNLIIAQNTVFQETLCLVGVLPTIMKFANLQYKHAIRLQAAKFIKEMCNASPLTLQMFIACRGLPILVEFLDHKDDQFVELKEIIFSAIDGILQVFNIPTTSTRTPKNDFCRLFSKHKLMNHLSRVLINLYEDKTEKDDKYLKRVATIILLFSQADSIVKMHMTQPEVLKRLLDSLYKLPNEHKLTILKCIKNLSLDPATFDSFEKTGGIPVIVSMLGSERQNIVNQALNSLFSLCKVNKRRQEIAATAGVIPHLQRIIENDSPLKHFALDMICDLAHTSKTARQELWKHDGVSFYIRLLEVDMWKVNVLESLAAWLADEPEAVEREILKEKNITGLINVFSSISTRSFINILQPLSKILNTALKVNNALGKSKFLDALIQVLEDHHDHKDALVRLNLLKTVQSIYKYSEYPKRIAGQKNLYSIIKKMATSKNVLVTETANQIIKAFDENLKL